MIQKSQSVSHLAHQVYFKTNHIQDGGRALSYMLAVVLEVKGSKIREVGYLIRLPLAMASKQRSKWVYMNGGKGSSFPLSSNPSFGFLFPGQ